MRGRRHIFASMVALLALGAPLCAIADEDSDKWQYAKGLFRSQLEKPTENINVGLHYWIELTRNGHSQKVSNKYAFHKGDKIQIHMKPNIDGYAYVVMRSGSRGESSVLFPDPAHGDSNRVNHGVDYALPSSGESFEFDENAGTEKLSLLLSRTPIDAQAYLAKPADQPVTIASANIGSKDLVPSQVFVAYATPHDAPPPPVKTTVKKTPASTKPVIASVDDNVESKAPKKKKTVSSSSSSSSTTTTTAFSTQTQTSKPPKHAVAAAAANDDAGVTTVVKKSPDGVLFVNVDLDHRS